MSFSSAISACDKAKRWVDALGLLEACERPNLVSRLMELAAFFFLFESVLLLGGFQFLFFSFLSWVLLLGGFQPPFSVFRGSLSWELNLDTTRLLDRLFVHVANERIPGPAQAVLGSWAEGIRFPPKKSSKMFAMAAGNATRLKDWQLSGASFLTTMAVT